MSSLPSSRTTPYPARRLQISLWRLIILVAISSAILAYVGSYYRLSRRGMDEARDYGLPGFLYVPFAAASASEDLRPHYALAYFYSPLNWVDRAVFGVPSPWIYITWRLSGGRRETGKHADS